MKGFVVFVALIFWTFEVMAVDNSHSNRLVKEKSPYLLQHAHNPVNWYPWGEEAFEKARKEDKPIFLSIGYSTCHWCHVMEEESFENPETAKSLNENFVSIKVDREERPDIDSVYMSYVMAATGSGGWPMSVFLTPDKKPFYGGTYFPPEDRWGVPGFKSLLHSIAESWRSEKSRILDSADSAVKFLSEKAPGAQAAGSVLNEQTLKEAFDRCQAGFDETYGGFGKAPKFPRSHTLSMLLRYWLRSGDGAALRMTEDTLKAMASGGIYDQLGGGFHRYSTDGRWRIPHFEKMLYDQALLVTAYLEAYQATGNTEYARVARETLDYVLTRMTSPEGGFYSAEDADSFEPNDPTKKREGAFYVWEKKEIADLLGGSQAEIFCYYFGVEEAGNALADPHGEFTRQNVLYLAHSAEETVAHFKTSVDQVKKILADGKARLLSARAKRPAPHLDDKVLTDWNGLMLTALARAAVVLGDDRYRAAAEKAAVFLDRTMRGKDGRLLHRYRGKDAGILANLNDYAFLIQGLLHLYETSFDPVWLQRSVSLADAMIDLFWDEARGGFYLTAKDAEVLISRPKEVYDGALPSGNSAAALALSYLGRYTGQDRYGIAAQRTMDAFAEMVAADPTNYPVMLMALDLALGPSREVVVAAQRRDENAESFLKEVQRPFFPNQVVLLRLAGREKDLDGTASFVSDKVPLSGKAAVYVCRDHTCRLPVTELEALKKLLKETVQK